MFVHVQGKVIIQSRNIMLKCHACLLCFILIQHAHSLTCPAGSYKPWYSDRCDACKSGYYTEHSGRTSCKVCPVGHQCYSVKNVPVKCPKGRYQDQTGQRYCKRCNLGEYNLDIGRTTKCDICPAGHRCYSVYEAPVKCPKGTYQDQTGQRYCKRCNLGEYSLETGRTTKCDICPAGHRCYAVYDAPLKCPKGTYQDQTGQRYCKRCNLGEYSLNIGRTTKCDICPAGHRCYSVYNAPVKCPKGTYQDEVGQRYCKGCNLGEYSLETGRTTKCDICPAGHRCYSVYNAPVKCPKGTYQDQKGQRYCKGCNIFRGEYSLEIARTTKCEICPAGHRCYSVDNPPIKCPKGTYQDQIGQRYCKGCNRGEYSLDIGRTTKCDICPAGHRCYSVDDSPIKCPKGTYQDEVGQRYCKGCNRGEYSLEIARTTKCDICTAGHRCYSVDDAPVKCPKGTYQDQKGQRHCKRCKAGQYNLQIGSTACMSCPAGSKCLIANKKPVPCKKGEYSPAESKNCFPCPTGSFCPSPSVLPVAPNKDTALKSKIHSTVKYAADAYKDKSDPALNGLRLIDSDNKIQGYVEFQDNTIVVSFRGTVDVNGWISNAKILQRNYQNCRDCKVHTGFSKHYNSVKLQMLAKVSALSHAHPNAKVIVTGHSLGGAKATLAAVDLTKAGYNTDLITYGSPRVGNKKFSEYVDKTLKGLNLRVTYKNDIVTVTPPQSIGYWHLGQEIHYTDPSTGFKLPEKMDVKYKRLKVGDHGVVNYEKLN